MKILLLGNGFDIFHKLPTKYQNFLHTVNFLKNNYNSSINTIGDVFSNEALRDKDICESYELYKEYYDKTSLNSEKIDKLISLSKSNIWFSYLSDSYNEDLNWIDFEREIGRVIRVFNQFFLIHYENNINIVDFSTFTKGTLFILRYFGFFFEEESKITDAGRPANSKNIIKKYQIEEPSGSDNYIINKGKIIDELYIQLRELSEMLKLYLECFVNTFTNVLKNNNSIIPRISVHDATHVCTLNYTNTFEILYSDKNIYHIHGNISNNIVLGINSDENDELPDLNTDFICFKKYYQRVFYKTDTEYQKFNSDMNKFVNNPYKKDDSVHVIGHSLDITDAEIIRNIFNRTNRIVIYYHQESAVKNYIRNLVEIYGKNKFDSLRTEKNLVFKPLSEIEVKKQSK